MDIVEPSRIESLLKLHLRENALLDEGPVAWSVGYSPLSGRGLFATRDISPGEQIFMDAALVVGPRCQTKYLPMCVNCYKSGCPLFPCDNGCGLPICSEDCEKSLEHASSECKYLRERVPNCGSTWSMDLLRAVVPIRALSLSNEKRELLAALQCHKSPSYEVKLLQNNVTNPANENDVEFMERVCGVMDTNSFETVVDIGKKCTASLRGLYPMGALQNHCCVPNSRHHFDANQRLCVSAAVPISAGEELTMTYTDLIWDTALRRQFLSATKHFLCKCPRCSDSSEFGSLLGALFCAADNCLGILLPRDSLNLETSWVCSECEKCVNNRQIRSIRSGLAAIVEEILYKSPRRILKFVETELSLLVPKNNYVMMDMKYRIISYFGRTKNLMWTDLTDDEVNVKCAYCKDLLLVLDALGCGDCKKRGLILYELYCTNSVHYKRMQMNGENCDVFCRKIYLENELLLKQAANILKDDIAAVNFIDKDCKINN